MITKKGIAFFIVLAVFITTLPFHVIAADTGGSEEILIEDESKGLDINEDENIDVKEKQEDETHTAVEEYNEMDSSSKKKINSFALAAAASYQVAIANSNRTFTSVGSPVSNFGQAKTNMNNNSNSNAVVLDTRRTVGNQVVAMKNGVVVTTADKVGKSTLSFYFNGPEKISTYVQNRIDAFYYDSTGSTVKMGISGQVVDGININQVELIPTVQAIQSYYTKNSNGELVHYVTNYTYYDNKNSDTTKRNRYIGSYQSFSICKAPSFMTANTKYFSVDGVKFYKDNKLTNHAGTFYPYYKYLTFRSNTTYTEDDLNNYIKSWKKSDSVLNGKGAAFIEAQNDFGVNAAMLLAFAAHESAYGTSKIAKEKNNLFGINATDGNPYGNADKYNSVEDCIKFQAEYMISRKYLDSNEDYRYFGPNVGSKSVGLNVKYASDPYWGEKIAGWIYRLDKYLGNKDANKYQLAISKTVTYAKSSPSTSASNYYKYAVKNYNVPQSGVPILITGNSNGWYEIQSDMPIDNKKTAPAHFYDLYNFSSSKAHVPTSNFTLINTPSVKYVDPVDQGQLMIPKGITRLGGATLWDTPKVISDFAWNTAESLVIASGNEYNDALAGAPLAGALKSPMLLTDKYTIPASTMKAIEKYKPKTIYVLGGWMVIDDKVINTLKSKGYNVKRVWGDTKYTTATAVGNEIRKMYKNDTAFVVNGDNFPDAISVTSIATKSHYPILFTSAKSIHKDTLKSLKSWGIKNVKIAGGDKVVTENIINQLKKAGFKVERTAGPVLWDTNIEVAKRYYPKSNSVSIATGEHYSDALTGGPMAAWANQPVLFVSKNSVRQDVLDYIKNNHVTKVTIFGGPSAVSDNVKNKIYNAMTK